MSLLLGRCRSSKILVMEEMWREEAGISISISTELGNVPESPPQIVLPSSAVKRVESFSSAWEEPGSWALCNMELQKRVQSLSLWRALRTWPEDLSQVLSSSQLCFLNTQRAFSRLALNVVSRAEISTAGLVQTLLNGGHPLPRSRHFIFYSLRFHQLFFFTVLLPSGPAT